MNMLAQFSTNQASMSSRDLLDLINQVRSNLGEPLLRLNKFNEKIEDELEGDHYTKSVVQNLNNTESVIYELTIDQCMLIGMRESKAVRKNVLATLKEKQEPFDITNPAHLLQAIEIQSKQNLALTQELSIAAPKVAFVDKYVESTGNKTFREVAKLLQIKEPAFRAFLQSQKIMYKLNGAWMAYSQHVDAKRFHVKTGVSDSGHAFNQVLFTPKGVEWIAGELAKFNLRGAA